MVCQIQADSSSGSALPHTATARPRCRTMESANGLARRICAVESCVPSATATADKIHFIFLICTIPQMPAVLGQSTSFALNGPPFTSMVNQQNAATNRGDRASACDEVACVKTALGFNKKKPHPEFGVRVRERCVDVVYRCRCRAENPSNSNLQLQLTPSPPSTYRQKWISLPSL